MSEALSFPLFTVMWNQLQRQVTPRLHIRIARWLQDGASSLRLLMAFRGAGKSTLVGLYCAWLLRDDPNRRILVLAADDALAAKMVRQVKRILERHPATKHLKPRLLDQWAADRFTVSRTVELRDPSMLAKGIGANLTGCRADIIICDDVEVPNTCDTHAKRVELRERLTELSYIKTPDGQILYVGTPHHQESLYAPDADKVTGSAAFLHNATRLEIPVLDENGDSAWPERFSHQEIEAIRRQTGPVKFSSQMMLLPVGMTDIRLDPACMTITEAPPSASVTQRVAAWDPAFGKTSGDGSVIAVCSALRGGMFYIDGVYWLRTISDGPVDEATQQCRAIIGLLQRHAITRLILETNGIGTFLPALLRKELKEARYGCAVVETVQRTNKNMRIISAFDPLLAARALSASPLTASSPLIHEMRAFDPSIAHNRDDGLDACATALLALTVSLSPTQQHRR